VSKRTDSPGLGSLASAALTAASTLVVTVASALAGVIIARELGRTPETDGFFAAYGVFIVIVLAAQAIRIAVLPSLARARTERRLAADLAGYAVALAVVSVPILLLAFLAADWIAGVLTGQGSETARDAATETLRWVVPAGIAQLFAGIAASGLAALDDYATAAFGYAAGSVLGILLMLERVESDGIAAVAWGMTLNAVVALLVPVVGLSLRALRARMPAAAVRPTGPPIRARLGAFAAAAALPLALQLVYVVCLPFAAREGVGAQTSFAYAYIGASALVAITAASLGLVTSVPLTRAGVDAAATKRHVTATSWLAFTVIGAATGAVVLAGAGLVQGVLGDAYGGDVGDEVSHLVVALSPWMAVSVVVSVSFPLTFVAGRTGALPWIGVAALAIQLPLAWFADAVLGLYGLAVSLAISTALVAVGLLHVLGAAASASRHVLGAAAAIALLVLLAFLPPALLLGSAASAIAGIVVYVLLVAVVRPRGLASGWRYLRALT